MKFSSSVLLALLPLLTRAQNFEGEPACAIPCLSAAIQQVGCPLTDQGCACASQVAIGGAAVGCFITACAATDIIKASSVGIALCSSYYAAMTTGGSVTVTTTASSASATASATASTNTPSLTSTATTSSGGDVLSIQTKTDVTSSTTVLSGTVTTSTPLTSSTPLSATVASTSTSRAAAEQGVVAGSISGFAGLVLGALALL